VLQKVLSKLPSPLRAKLARHQVKAVPEKLAEAALPADHQLHFFAEAHGVDIGSGKSHEELLKAVSCKVGSMQMPNTFSPEARNLRVCALKHWKTGDPKDESVADPKKFRAKHRKGHNWQKKGFHVETTGEGQDLLLRKCNDGQTCKVAHVFEEFDAIKEHHRSIACLKTSSTCNKVKEKFANTSERERKAFVDTCPGCA
jgi:hypothetical protein